jgi:hypothetical protein
MDLSHLTCIAWINLMSGTQDPHGTRNHMVGAVLALLHPLAMSAYGVVKSAPRRQDLARNVAKVVTLRGGGSYFNPETGVTAR